MTGPLSTTDLHFDNFAVVVVSWFLIVSCFLIALVCDLVVSWSSSSPSQLTTKGSVLVHGTVCELILLPC